WRLHAVVSAYRLAPPSRRASYHSRCCGVGAPTLDDPAKQPGVLMTPLKMLSVVIPARDEEECVGGTVEHLHLELELHRIPHEIVVVDDGSSDVTWQILQDLSQRMPALRPIRNDGPHGFGKAVAKGIDAAGGDGVVVMMADESDDCRDVVRYWLLLNEG